MKRVKPQYRCGYLDVKEPSMWWGVAVKDINRNNMPSYQNAVEAERLKYVLRGEFVAKKELARSANAKGYRENPAAIIANKIPKALIHQAHAVVNTLDLRDAQRMASIKAIRKMNKLLPGCILHDVEILQVIEEKICCAANGTPDQMGEAQDWLKRIITPTSEGSQRQRVDSFTVWFYIQPIYRDVVFARSIYKQLNDLANDRNWTLDQMNKHIGGFATMDRDWRDLVLPVGRALGPVVTAATMLGKSVNRRWRDVLKQLSHDSGEWAERIKYLKSVAQSQADETVMAIRTGVSPDNTFWQ